MVLSGRERAGLAPRLTASSCGRPVLSTGHDGRLCLTATPLPGTVAISSRHEPADDRAPGLASPSGGVHGGVHGGHTGAKTQRGTGASRHILPCFQNGNNAVAARGPWSARPVRSNRINPFSDRNSARSGTRGKAKIGSGFGPDQPCQRRGVPAGDDVFGVGPQCRPVALVRCKPACLAGISSQAH